MLKQLQRLLNRTSLRRVIGADNLPRHGGVLILTQLRNPGAFPLLEKAVSRPFRQTALAQIDDTTLLQALRGGEAVVLAPRVAVIPPFAGDDIARIAAAARDANVPVVAAWIEDEPEGVMVRLSPAIPSDGCTPDAVFKTFFDLGEEAITLRPELDSHLGYEVLKALRKNAFNVVVTDGMQKKDIKGFLLLGLGILLSRTIQAETRQKRVGVLLPPGAGGFIANLGVILAGRIPVNLNFTAGRAANESSIARSGLDTVITAEAFEEKIKDRDFPYPPNKLDIGEVLKALPKWQIALAGIAARLIPSSFMARFLGVPRTGGNDEAVLLFTSGSSGMPKGVGLSHRNVLGNIRQIETAFAPYGAKRVLACLPTFHSFGSTVTLWWPMLGGPHAITWPNPLDAGRLVELIASHHIELVCTTPTFLRAMARKATAEQMKTLNLVIAGAEKLPPDLRESFIKNLNIPLCEGYGTTEASPVVSTNLPEKGDGVPRDKPGSVGRLVPGMNLTLRDIETGEPVSFFRQGLIHVRGANIFGGYLNDPEKNAEAIHDGWYNTGDLGRMDADGFLFVEGRLSRFSKIGGEMVPHGTVEDKVRQVLTVPADESPVSLVIVGVPDERKGEALVMLSTNDISLDDLRKKLKDVQLTELWMPKKIYKVESIPVLGTGKLNLKECQKKARELASKEN